MDNKNDKLTEGSLYGPHSRTVVPAAKVLVVPGPVWQRLVGGEWTPERLGPRPLMVPPGVVFRTKPSLVPLDGSGGIRRINELWTDIRRHLAGSASVVDCGGAAPREASTPPPPVKFDSEPPARVPAPSTPEKRTSAARLHATAPATARKPRRPRQRYATNDPERVRAGGLIDEVAAAELLGLAPSTLRNMRCSGGGPPFTRVGDRSIRYDPRDLEKWISARRVNSTSQRCGDD